MVAFALLIIFLISPDASFIIEYPPSEPVMNPVDHPHGGGEGKSSGGRNPVSPWGQSAKGLKTRNNKRTNKYIIMRRKKRV